MKSSGAFRVTQLSPGVFDWRTASGHTYPRSLDGTVYELGRATYTGEFPF